MGPICLMGPIRHIGRMKILSSNDDDVVKSPICGVIVFGRTFFFGFYDMDSGVNRLNKNIRTLWVCIFNRDPYTQN